jgi:hypothetical protein
MFLNLRKYIFKWTLGGIKVGKKHRNRINSPKKNNHIPASDIVAEHEAHAKEVTATGGRKNNQ